MALPHSTLLLALALALSACGHRGDPQPPRRRTPPTLADFRLAQRGEALEAACTAPRASLDGVLYGRVGVEIFWAEGQVDLERAGRRRKVEVPPGARVVETLPLPAPGTLVRSAARAVVGGDRGQRSLIRALEVQPLLVPPHELTVQLVEKGVALSWKGPRPEPVAPPDLGLPTGEPPLFGGRRREPAVGAGSLTRPTETTLAEGPRPEAGEPSAEEASSDEPAAPRPHGFHVYRRIGPAPYGRPLNVDPEGGRQFTDEQARLGATVCYVIRAVASVEPLIESAPSNEACLDVRDISPPGAPGGLAVLPREGGLEVLWSPSPEADLAQYRVYRGRGEAGGERLAEVPAGTTTWLDASAETGALYRYTVTAVDRAGNESPHSASVQGRRP